MCSVKACWVCAGVAGRVVSVTSPDKMMFPQPGLTKLDVVDYYLRIEAPLMAAIRGRPILMQRFPSGVDGSNFRDYLAAPGVLAVGGSWIAPAEVVRAGRYDEIERLAQQAQETLS